MAGFLNYLNYILKANCFSVDTGNTTRFCAVATVVYVKIWCSRNLETIFDLFEHLLPRKLSDMSMYFNSGVTFSFVFDDLVETFTDEIGFRTSCSINNCLAIQKFNKFFLIFRTQISLNHVIWFCFLKRFRFFGDVGTPKYYHLGSYHVFLVLTAITTESHFLK